MGKQVISQNEEGNKAAKPEWKEAWSKWKVWQSSAGAISPQILSTVLRDQKHAWKVGICVTSLIWEAVHLSNLYFKLCCSFTGRHHYSPPLAFSSANIQNPIIHQCRRFCRRWGPECREQSPGFGMIVRPHAISMALWSFRGCISSGIGRKFTPSLNILSHLS